MCGGNLRGSWPAALSVSPPYCLQVSGRERRAPHPSALPGRPVILRVEAFLSAPETLQDIGREELACGGREVAAALPSMYRGRQGSRALVFSFMRIPWDPHSDVNSLPLSRRKAGLLPALSGGVWPFLLLPRPPEAPTPVSVTSSGWKASPQSSRAALGPGLAP